MRTDDMIYQAAIAHQTELRRDASGRTPRSDRDGGPSRWNRLLSLITAQARASAATRQPGTGIVTRHLSA